MNFPNDVWSGHLSYREFGEHYDPAVGFVNRNDFRRIEPRIGWSPRPERIRWIRQLNWDVQFRYLTEMGTGILEERELSLGVLGIDFESGDFLNFQVNRTYEFLDSPFEIVRQSLEQAQARTGLPPQRFRPWLQAFRDYAFDRRVLISFTLGGVPR